MHLPRRRRLDLLTRLPVREFSGSRPDGVFPSRAARVAPRPHRPSRIVETPERQPESDTARATILIGASFLGMQAYEWSHFIHEGARLNSNPWGVPQFSAAFFIITGFHGMHVTTGVTILLIVAIRSALGKYSPQGVENAGLYWHFVDLVWVFVFALFYLV